MKKDFSDFNNKNCSTLLNINLTNAKVNSCVITDGQITVTWWGQILNKDDDNNDDNNLKDKNLFSYSLTAGQS